MSAADHKPKPLTPRQRRLYQAACDAARRERGNAPTKLGDELQQSLDVLAAVKAHIRLKGVR